MTTVAAVALGTGVGASSSVFAIVQTTFLRPLAYPHPERLVWLSDQYRDWERPGGSQSLPNILDLRERLAGTLALDAYAGRVATVGGEGMARRISGIAVGPGFLGVLDVEPVLGRDFAPDDSKTDAPRVVILSHRLWMERFGAAASAVGGEAILEATPYRIIGVLPEWFEFFGDPDFLVPLRYEAGSVGREGRGFYSVGRLASGVSLDAAKEDLERAFAGLVVDHPEANSGWQVRLDPLDRALVSDVARPVTLLAVAAGLLLFVACANVAGLILVSAEGRRREVALRRALGAGRVHLASLLLSEGVALGAASGFVGVVVAHLMLPPMLDRLGDDLFRLPFIHVGPRVIAFTFFLSFGAAAVLSLFPLLRRTDGDVHREVRHGGMATPGGLATLRGALVVAEVAVAVVMTTGASLFLDSVAQLSRVDVGLAQPDAVLSVHVALPGGTYPDTESAYSFFTDFVGGVSRLPGVVEVGLTNKLPLHGGYNVTNLYVGGSPGRLSHFVEVRSVSPGFFKAAGVGHIAGRLLTDADGVEGRNVVVTQRLARELFDDPAAAVGRTVTMGEGSPSLRVVGVVTDVRDMGVKSAAPPALYHAIGPATVRDRSMVALIRSTGDADEVLSGVVDVARDIDPLVPVYGAASLSTVIERALEGDRVNASVAALFAFLSLLLSALGVYATMSFTATVRTREVGLRVALGAQRGAVVRTVLWGGVRLAVVGCLVGVAIALPAGRALGAVLYRVDPMELGHVGVVVLLLLATSAIASYLPARRASEVDPSVALRD